jgi:hypothetical protein
VPAAWNLRPDEQNTPDHETPGGVFRDAGWADTTGRRSETPRMRESPRQVAESGALKHASGRLHTGNVKRPDGEKHAR